MNDILDDGLSFGRWQLDLKARQLLTGGAPVPLARRAFDVLLALVQAQGELVTKDQLLRLVWPGLTVEENNLEVHVSALRKALGDGARILIATVPGRGYRFVGPVQLATVPTEATLPDPSFALCHGRPIVVVMPFEGIGDELGRDYFADGLTADLVTDLTRFDALHVVCPRHADWLPGSPLPANPWPGEGRTAARHADYLVSGTVRRGGGRVRITTRLEGAASGVVVWAERFDRPLDDLFAVQQEVASRIAAHLVSRMDRETIQRARGRAPANHDAYDLCLRGRDLHARATEADTLRAREVLASAIATDPLHAPAWSWQAYVIQRGFTHGWGEARGQDALQQAYGHAQHAAELEPDSPLSLACLSLILLLCGRRSKALEVSRRAVELNPSSWVARLDHGIVLTEVDPGAGLREIKSALALDPFHLPWVRGALGNAPLLAGRQEEALAQLQWCVRRLPDYLPVRENMVVAAVEAGRLDEARLAVREVLRIGPHRTLRTMASKWSYFAPANRERFYAAFCAAGLAEG